MFALRQTLLCFAVSAAALAVEPEAGFLQRIETNLAVIEHLLGTLRHVAVTTEEGGATRTRLTSEAWFVPDDAVETPVKVTLLEARGTEQREIAFWLDQGKLFLVKERTLVNQEASVMVTEHRRYFDGGRLVKLESRSGVSASGETAAPFVPVELPNDSETQGAMLEEIALETASQLAPVSVTNRPVRWD